VTFNPIEGSVKEIFEKAIMPNDFNKTDNRDGSQIIKQLGACGLQLHTPKTSHFQVGLLTKKIRQQLRSMFIT
jgi:hypothetical protein